MSGSRAKKQRQDQTDTTAAFARLSEIEADQWDDSYRHQQQRHTDWAEKERLLLVQPNDTKSAEYNNQISDGRLSTIVIERAARVMAQLPTGVVRVLTKKNRGLAKLYGLFLTRYIQPFDKLQFPHLTKLRITDLYSQVYGVMPVLYDLAVTEQYLGPSFWVLPIRSWFPQPYKLSIDDSDYNHIETRVSASWLESQKGVGSWNSAVIDYVLGQLKGKEGSSPANDNHNQQSVREQQNTSSTSGGTDKAASIRLVTRHENGSEGRWKTFLPDYDNIIARDAKSKDGHIPIVLKHHIPLIDDIYGLGAFERGKRLQYAMDSLVAMYMAGVQMSIFPPRIIQKDQIVASSLKYAPGATWIEKVKDAIRNYNVSPAGMETFQSTYGWLTASLLNQNGTTDTSITAKGSSDPSMGKTPEALKLQASRESAADAWDQAMMEQFIETLYERQLNLAADTPKPFTFHVFDAEIKEIRDSGLEDVMDIFETEKEAEITLSKKYLFKKTKFYIDGGTTLQEDQTTQHLAYKELVDAFVAAPQLIGILSAQGYKFSFGEVIKQYVITGGAKDPEKIISQVQPDTPTGDGEAAGPQAMMDALTGKPAPQPEAPDPTKDADHQLIMKLIDKLGPDAIRALAKSVGLPANTMLPVEAEMIEKLSRPSQFDEQGIKEDRIEIDPDSPYGAAKDPLSHVQSSKDPMVQNLLASITSTKPGAPMDAIPLPEGTPTATGVA